jgi:uncharacterized membrane protein
VADWEAQGLLTTSRVEALSDGVFAIAMTLLVLTLDVPVLPSHAGSAELSSALSALLPHVWSFLLSFVLLGSFWVVHHRQYQHIRHATEASIWINLIALLFVVILPFSTDLQGEYGNLALANIVFETNLLLIGLSYLAQWWYATKVANLVDPELDPETIRLGLLRNLVVPAVSLVAILLALVTPSGSTLVYLLIFPIMRVLLRRKKPAHGRPTA